MRSKKAGGGDLAVIIATPIQADARSQERLIRKLENYVAYIHSDEFAADCGKPTLENTSIVVRIHPDSDPAMFELLERCSAPVN